MSLGMASNRGFEVHEHWDLRVCGGRLRHSHDGGNARHQHAGYGPASYTIDKDDWFRTTGLSGGGRKKFTKRPSGRQELIVALEPWQGTFEIQIVGDGGVEAAREGEGPGVALPVRLILANKMTATWPDDNS